MNMKVLLISPAFGGFARGIPLGLGYLGAMLELNGVEVKILDIATQNISDIELTHILETFRPNVIGVTSVCANYLNALDAISVAKKVLGQALKVVLGGPHATFGAETILLNHDNIDFCVIGEGEISFLNLIKHIDSPNGNLKNIKGIAFKVNNKVEFTEPQNKITDLDILPLPARHLYDLNQFPPTISDKVVNSTFNTELIASRGCPYLCGFCSTKEFWGKTYRRKSSRNVIKELTFLVSKGFTGFYFNDDIFTIDRNWVIELCHLIMDFDIPITWACGTRVDRIDKELLVIMKNAGCGFINFGVESGNEFIIKDQNKKATIKQAERAFELLREVGIYSSSNLVFGFPGETLETAKKTVEWVRDIVRPDDLWISKACCYPGTLLAKYYDITAIDYETKINNRCSKGWIYGSGGIYTPFFNDEQKVIELWEYIKIELGNRDLLFGDEIDNYNMGSYIY